MRNTESLKLKNQDAILAIMIHRQKKIT